MNRKGVWGVFALLALTGCTAVPHKVDLMYQPQMAAVKNLNGRIYLASLKVFSNAETPPERWVIGRVREKDGVQNDEITSSVSPRDQVADALSQELEKAGYQVSTGQLTPDAVTEPYLRLNDVKIDIDEETTLYSITTTARVTMNVELWKGGQLVKKNNYDSGYFETYPRTRSEEIQTVLQKALEGVTGKAVPDIVRSFAS